MKSWLGIVIVMAYVSLWYIPKAILEAAYFKDRRDAMRTLFLWFISFKSLCVALGFTLLIDYLC